MSRLVLGGVLALILVGIGVFWWQGRAAVEEGAPPPMAQPERPSPEDLPTANAGELKGPAPPQATELTREEQRFFRYDRNRDRRITRNEMLSTRSDAFRKLDRDGNNLLDFEEWAVATVERFEKADGNGDRELDMGEFAKTAPKAARRKPSCRC
ncbi:EF hand [Tsuneonella dongtanensis]|uniref:EF hand n=1 Tax=Tsuneonella dongtanensis TaxID=692370 RepID=A0A1B2AEU9_9SPHN|nr:EF-hand domain-containing protein [Tsuneonella dongtanensis]ANY20682.1 EF hand [Tsuneonella dongtanensis]